MSDKHFILHLSLIDGVGPIAIQKIIEIIRSGVNAPDFYSFSESDWMRNCGFTQAMAHKVVVGLSDTKSLETELYLIEYHSIQWVTIIENTYPTLLRHIYMPPAVLYWQGGSFNDQQKHIAIVGSRAANVYGSKVVHTLVPDLVQADVVVVSGGALGIDAIAHDVALKSRGKTIAVLGSGLLKPMPTTNKSLFKKIVASGGLLVSSFPLLSDAKPGNFPARNRIIAGLSHGCLVVQAAQKSGALITAHYALEQGREVFAVPGAIDDPLSVGCHELIQCGAKLVISSADIVEECAMQEKAVRDIQITLHDAQKLMKQGQVCNSTTMANYSEIQKKIINVCLQPASLDDIMQKTNLDMNVVQAELFSLQLDGKISQDFIGMWVVN